jgi:hypothetical protein
MKGRVICDTNAIELMIRHGESIINYLYTLMNFGKKIWDHHSLGLPPIILGLYKKLFFSARRDKGKEEKKKRSAQREKSAFLFLLLFHFLYATLRAKKAAFSM